MSNRTCVKIQKTKPMKKIQDTEVKNKKVLIRADLNVPTENGKVTDTTRIEAIVPTIAYLKQNNARIYLMSHFGRPEGQHNPEFSLEQIIPELEKILETKIKFIFDCTHHEDLNENEIGLLENTRFHPEEKKNDSDFAKKIAAHYDLYVNDAFGAAHRAHASTEAITNHLPSFAGLLMQKEIDNLSPLLNEKNITVILGGSKIDTKIGVIKNFFDNAKSILIGGALANTFIEAKGYDIGASKSESDKIEIARETLLMAEQNQIPIHTPSDALVADEISDTATTINIPLEDVEMQMMILDIGLITTETFIEKINESETIIMNGPMGLYEKSPFESGTRKILEALANHEGKTIIGGGDTIDALNKFKIDHSKITHISTGGGAMLEFLEGKTLPALKKLD